MTKAELIDSYAEWLRERRWNLFATLTFRGSPSRNKADRIFRQWISEMQQQEGTESFSWVRVTELGANKDNVHFHALIGGLRNPSKWPWILRWDELAGEADVFYYQPYLGGLRYMLKEARPGCDFDIEIHMAPLGKHQ